VRGVHTSACWRAEEPERWPGPIAEVALEGVHG